MDRICGILFDQRSPCEPEDVEGCVKMGYHEVHEFVCKEGKTWEWEYDYGCLCGCTDDIENNPNDVCIIYSEKI